MSKKKNPQFSRKRPSRDRYKRILIVCEGTKTEPIYFGAIRKEKRLTTTAIHVVGTAKSSVSLIEEAKKLYIEVEKDVDLKYDEVYCVFDRDDHLNIPAAFDMARKNDFTVIFSNPCFELWFLLHFEDQKSYIDRKKVKSLLNKHFKAVYKKEYDKSKDIYNDLKQSQETAIQRAKELRKLHKDSLKQETENPSTNVDVLLEALDKIANYFY